MIIRRVKARQAPPRNLAEGPVVNQLTGTPYHYFPKYQDMDIELIDEKPYVRPQPVNAWEHWDNGPDVTLIPEEKDEAVPNLEPAAYRPRRRRSRRSPQ